MKIALIPAIAATLVMLTIPASLAAEVDNTILNALLDKDVEIILASGTILQGKVIWVEELTIVLMQTTGTLMKIEKTQIDSIAIRTWKGQYVYGISDEEYLGVQQLVSKTSAAELPVLLNSHPLIAKLSPMQQSALVGSTTKSEKYYLGGFWINILYPGAGSFIQQDFIAGSILTAMSTAGLPLLILGWLDTVMNYEFNQSLVYFNIYERAISAFVIGGTLITTAYIIGIIRPFFFHGRKYNTLRKYFSLSEKFIFFEIHPAGASAINRAGASPDTRSNSFRGGLTFRF